MKFLRLALLIYILPTFFSCEKGLEKVAVKKDLADFSEYIPSKTTIKAYDIYNLNDPISKYDWKNWELYDIFKKPYDFRKYYSFSSSTSELSKFNDIIFDPINIYTINDTISEVELIAKEYIRERPSSYPEILLDKSNVDQVIEIFKEKFGPYDRYMASSSQITQPDKYYWILNNHTIEIEVRTFSRPFFIPIEKDKYDKFMNEENKKKRKTLAEKLDFSNKNIEKFDGETLILIVTSLKITFKSRYMDSIERKIYSKFDELKLTNDSINKIKAKEKL